MPDSTIGGKQSGFDVIKMLNIVNFATASANAKIEQMRARRSSISIADMFDMQMLMNHLSQLSEMSTSVIAAANSAIQSMSRNIKS
jgi:hypothetical protein